MRNQTLSDRCKIVATIDPDNYTPGAQTSDWVSMANFKSILAVVLGGALGASGTVNAKLQEATDSSGTGAQDISGKAITEFSTSDAQAVIGCRDDELSSGFTHVALVVTGAVATSDLAGVILGLDSDYSENADLASVVEIV